MFSPVMDGERARAGSVYPLVASLAGAWLGHAPVELPGREEPQLLRGKIGTKQVPNKWLLISGMKLNNFILWTDIDPVLHSQQVEEGLASHPEVGGLEGHKCT